MSDEPPIDDPPTEAPPAGAPPADPAVDDVVAQLDDALADAGVSDHSLRGALTDKLRLVLGSLTDLDDVDLTVDILASGPDSPAEPPEVTVVDGGRGPGQPRVRRARPDLRVAGSGGSEDDPTQSQGTQSQGTQSQGTQSQGTQSGDADADASSSPRFTSRRRVRLRPGGGASALARVGRIAVSAGGRQTVYRGPQAHPYRILCGRGALSISVDGAQLDTLSSGQSLDVVGSTVVVRAAPDDSASGTYARL